MPKNKTGTSRYNPPVCHVCGRILQPLIEGGLWGKVFFGCLYRHEKDHNNR